VVDLIDKRALEQGNEREAVAPVVSALTELSIRDIESFDEYLAQALYAIDGKTFADNAGDSGRSDDGFLYIRCYVVARGQHYYSRVAADPAAMPNAIEQWCETLLYAARNAWATKTGRDPEEWDFEPSVSYESASNESLWP
jgi:hypothetical protein